MSKELNSEKIAIVILTHNRYSSFKEVLRSALSQKGVDFHVFIFDDSQQTLLSDFVRDVVMEGSDKKQVTYIHFGKNLKFGDAFRSALNYVKKEGMGFSFLLGDDDLIAHPYAIRELLDLMEKDNDVHVVRGGFVTFIGHVRNFSQLYVYDKKDIAQCSFMSECKKALSLHVPYYSGILFKNEFFDPEMGHENDFYTPFLAPLLKILLNKKFEFLPDKVTIFDRTEHDQLATRIYNESFSNAEGILKACRMVGLEYSIKPEIHELINHKIYSRHRSYIRAYYKTCLAHWDRSFKSFLFRVAYYTPRLVLLVLKRLTKKFIGFSTKRKIARKHRYLIRTISNRPA